MCVKISSCSQTISFASNSSRSANEPKVNIKFLIVFVALFAVALAGVVPKAYIEKSFSDVGPENFAFDWKTSDGQQAEAQGVLGNVGSDHEALAVKGSYSYVGDDGVTYEVTYIADENGFQPQGAHLPVAPEA